VEPGYIQLEGWGGGGELGVSDTRSYRHEIMDANGLDLMPAGECVFSEIRQNCQGTH